MRNRFSILLAAMLVALLAAGCPKGKGPGGLGVPDKPDVPGGGVPGGLGGSSGMVDPNSCGNYAATEAGARFKAFLNALVEMQKSTEETVKIVKQSCIMIGTEIGMIEAELQKEETKVACAKVYAEVDKMKKVAFKANAKLAVKYKPAVCRINVEAQAKVAAECEGKATADVKARCTGRCDGKCNGQCAGKAGTGGNAGKCEGECKGTCEGKCEGSADVDASARCKGEASAKASVDMECTEAELDISLDAKMQADTKSAEKLIKGLKAGIPKIFSVKARLAMMERAAVNLLAAANELKEMGPKFVNSFKDQALCIGGQVAAGVKAATSIQANVSVSVEVSASASGSVGGGT
jgi:modification target Cys-rich repeat protein